MDRTLQDLLSKRIDDDPRLDEAAGLLILAAADGSDALELALEDRAVDRAGPTATAEQAVEPARAYLGPITVEGFRGVGPPASLPLQPGPGLTLVVGRNGSGKSSFAEAIEILLTGDNRRWSDRSVIWREGWRNLHHPLPTEVSAELAMEGVNGGTTVRRWWSQGAELEQSVTEVQPHGQRKTDLRSLGWEQDLVTFRPFLSYNELGSMLDEGPSKLYDALSSVLGLDELVIIEKLLADARRERERAHKEAHASLQRLLTGLEQLDDDRARRCLEALVGKRWDTEAVESVLLGAAAGADAAGELEVLRRNQRFEPIAEEAQRIWELLRQQSNVELARPELEGTGTRRRVKLDVTVDGVGGAALGVMSQGELHSLALSLFLPRAMLAESPFRFIVIDDPVQSMDPARVDGLARVLEDVGSKRQLVVLTHDDRLPETVRRLEIDARILEVTRQPGSVVMVVEALDPVDRSISDAWVIARDEELPAEVAARLIPGFCREAIEAACTEVVRRRRLGRGERHEAVEKLLLGLTTTKQLAALALLDNPDRAGDVYTRLNDSFGRWAGDVFRAVNEGAHSGYAGDLSNLIRDADILAKKIRALA